jgi:hypothetical protein
MTADVFVSTSVARRLISRMQATHERRRISVFAGPPGIGKTTAIDALAQRLKGSVAIVKVARRNAKEGLVLQHALEAVRRVVGIGFTHAPSSLWDLRNDLFIALCQWAGVEPGQARKGEYPPEAFERLTLVFDEAQNLSRDAIEALRFWNDQDRCYAPFPLGMVFVGNNEFSLAGAPGESVLSAAVADRALYLQTLEYADVTDDDLELFVDARVSATAEGVSAIVRAFRGPRSIRSLRRVGDLLDDLVALSGGSAITPALVQQALELA